MQNDSQDNSVVDDHFVESLLYQAFRFDQDAEDERVEQLLISIRKSDLRIAASSKSNFQSRVRFNWASYRSWIGVAACLLFMCVIGFLLVSNTNTAYATVARASETLFPSREYRVEMLNLWPGVGEKNVVATLYLNGQNDFCLQHPGWLPGGELWVGGSNDSRWIVPRIGPIITGDRNLFNSVLSQKGLATPALQLQTILKRMGQEYQLTLLDEVELANPRTGESIFCQHVVGIVRESKDRLPTRIELWANRTSGVAERIVLEWSNPTFLSPPKRWQIDLVGYPELTSDWFEYQGHSEPGRLRVPFEQLNE